MKMKLIPKITITVLPGHAAHVGITERGCPSREVGRKKGQQLLFEHVVAGDIIHTEEQTIHGHKVKGILIYDRIEFDAAKKHHGVSLAYDRS